MDYSKLAVQWLDNMQALHKAKLQKHITEALQGEAFVLSYIANRDDDVFPGEICHEMDVSSARIAQALNSIEKKGWVTRQIDSNDRRQVIVNLTSEGKIVAEEHQQIIIGLAAKLLNFLGEEDAQEYVRITSKLADIVSKYKGSL